MSQFLIDDKTYTFTEVIKSNDEQLLKKMIVLLSANDKNYKNLLKKIVIDNRIDLLDYIRDNTNNDLYKAALNDDLMKIIRQFDNGHFFENYTNNYIKFNTHSPKLKFHTIATLLQQIIHFGIEGGIENLIDLYANTPTISFQPGAPQKNISQEGLAQMLREILSSPNYSIDQKFDIFKNMKEKYNIDLNKNTYLEFQNFVLMACKEKNIPILNYLLTEKVEFTPAKAIVLAITKDSKIMLDILLKHTYPNENFTRSCELKYYKCLLLSAKKNALDCFQHLESKGGNIEDEEIVKTVFKTKKSKKIQAYLLTKLAPEKLKLALPTCHASIKPILFNYLLESSLVNNEAVNKKTRKL